MKRKKMYLDEIQDRIQELRKIIDEMPEYRRAVSYGVSINSSSLLYRNTELNINTRIQLSLKPLVSK